MFQARGTDCPNENELAALVERGLSDEALPSSIEAHISRCAICREALAGVIGAARNADALWREDSLSPEGKALLPGSLVGRYRVVELLGSGAMGNVYVAFDPELDRRVAVKVLRYEGSDDTGDLENRLRREAKAMAKLSHPNVVTVYDVGTSAGRVFIAMELVAGATLREWLARAPRSCREIVEVFVKAGRGLSAAHSAGLTHRDFKPDNVLVTGDGDVRVTDFGLARADSDAAPESPERETDPEPIRTESRLTRTGAAIGTPAYMAPEQLERRGADARSDLFSYCVALWEGLYGRRPFEGKTSAQLREAIRGGRATPEASSVVPRRVRDALLIGLRDDPAERYPSMAPLLERLEGLPRLARDVAELAQRAYPQPIAEAVAELDMMRSAYRALDAAARVVRLSLRMLSVIGLAVWAQRRAEPLPPIAAALLSALRKRRLEDEEWLELLREVLAPFAAAELEHPVPELVRLVQSPVTATLALFIARRPGRGVHAVTNEEGAAEELSSVLAQTAEWLRALAFLCDYSLVVVGADHCAELWTGVRRKYRPPCAIPLGMRLEPNAPMLLCKDGGALVLAPLATAGRPSPHAEPELFLLEGRGRRGLLLVALPGGFEQTSEAALAWLNRMAAVSDTAESGDTPLDAPYRGLAPLTTADSDVFFGREREVEAFVNRLRTEPLLVVAGPSGAGKSSFVRAGVIPSLGAPFHAVVFRPGATPLKTLRARLAHLGAPTDDLRAASDAGEVTARVHAAMSARDETLVLCIDQFEETFTLGRDAHERAVFCAWLAGMASSAPDPVRVVLTLRDDFLAKAQQESALEQRLAAALELLTTPHRLALRRILVEPARRAGFAFESEALVDEMVRAVEGRPGALALLSFTASKLWEQRDPVRRALTSAAYEAMGGVAGALAKHGESLLERMTPRQRALVRETFRRLVTAEGTRATTRLDELVATLGGDAAARAVTEKLVAARLLVIAECDDGTETVEVIHEALLSAWPRLLEWQREDAAGNRLRDQVRAAAQQWEARHRPRSLLWRDELVEDYRRWRSQHPGGLTPSEEAFGQASLADRDRARRLRAAVITLLAIAAAVSSFVARQQTLARRTAQRATLEATQATLEAKQANLRAEQSAMRARDAARLAEAHLYADDPTTQLALLRDLEASEPPAEWAPDARAALHAGVASVVFERRAGQISSIAFSPDGRRIALAEDKAVQVWNADGAGEPVTLPLRGPDEFVLAVAFSPDGRHLVAGSWDNTMHLWNADGSGEPLVFRGHTGPVCDVAFSPDGRSIASGSSDHTVRVWKADGSEAPLVLVGHTATVHGVSFSPDGRSIASGSSDKTVRVWNADGSGSPLVLRGHTDQVFGVSFSPDGRHIASGSWDRTVRVWNTDGTSPPLVLHPLSFVQSVAFSPDGRRIASASSDHIVRIWSADGLGEPVVFSATAEALTDVAFSPDGRRIASACYDGTVRVWNIDGSHDPLVLHAAGVSRLSVSSDGSHVASASDDKTVRVWSADGSEKPIVLRGHTDSAVAVSFSPDGKRVASGSDDRTVRVWNADGSGDPLVLRGHTDIINDVDFSPDGRRVASASNDTTVRVWNADGSGEPLVLHHPTRVWSVSFSPDGRRIACSCVGGAVYLWNAEGSGEPLLLQGHTGVVTTASFSPDGRRIATGSGDKTVRVWSADGSGDSVILRGHIAAVERVSFSPDGLQIVSGSADKTIRIWDASGVGDPIVLHGHTDAVRDVAFSPDGSRLFSCSDDNTIRIWSDLAPLLPTDPRLWLATRYCLSPERQKEFLGVNDDVAQALHARCLERVAASSGRP